MIRVFQARLFQLLVDLVLQSSVPASPTSSSVAMSRS